MTDVVAAIGLAQMHRYDKLLQRRKEIVKKYNEGFKDLNLKLLPHLCEDKTSSCHLYIARLLGFTSEQRNRFIELMAESGIACNVHYKPLPMFTAYKQLGFDIKNYPNAYEHYHDEVTLPLHTKLSDEDVERIISTFREVYKQLK